MLSTSSFVSSLKPRSSVLRAFLSRSDVISMSGKNYSAWYACFRSSRMKKACSVRNFLFSVKSRKKKARSTVIYTCSRRVFLFSMLRAQNDALTPALIDQKGRMISFFIRPFFLLSSPPLQYPPEASSPGAGHSAGAIGPLRAPAMSGALPPGGTRSSPWTGEIRGNHIRRS